MHFARPPFFILDFSKYQSVFAGCEDRGQVHGLAGDDPTCNGQGSAVAGSAGGAIGQNDSQRAGSLQLPVAGGGHPDVRVLAADTAVSSRVEALRLCQNLVAWLVVVYQTA